MEHIKNLLFSIKCYSYHNISPRLGIVYTRLIMKWHVITGFWWTKIYYPFLASEDELIERDRQLRELRGFAKDSFAKIDEIFSLLNDPKVSSDEFVEKVSNLRI